MMKFRIAAVLLMLLILSAGTAFADAPEKDAEQLVRDAFDYYRGKASVSTVEMAIVRPDWQRTMRLNAWTEGQANSLFRIVEPPRDAGNGTLKKGREMWIYNPKVNRAIKIPPAMMSQSWMGSDFSNNDLAKSDSLITDYTHRITGRQTADGHTVYLVESIPRPGAPVVWGMLLLKIRDDRIFLEETFFDEDRRPVKRLEFSDIGMLGGRLYPATMKMYKVDTPESYTEVHNRSITFKDDLPDRIFSLTNLTNPER